MTPNCYAAFGLVIASEIPLLARKISNGETDLQIRCCRIKEKSSESGDALCSRDSGACHINCNLGRFIIQDGREILVDPAPATDDRVLMYFLLERLVVLALLQRGDLAFHASLVKVGETALALMGAPHAGKTTLSLALNPGGQFLLDDDILIVREQLGKPISQPGYPLIKIWPDTARLAGLAPELRSPQFESEEKPILHLGTQWQVEAAPLRKVYIIEEHPSTAVIPLGAVEAIRHLMPHWYGMLYREIFQLAGGYSRALEQAGHLARTTEVSILRRPRGFERVPEIVRMIKADLAADGSL